MNQKNLKYKDVINFEPVSDVYFFYPISSVIADIFYKFRLTPNQVTIISTIIRLLGSYMLYNYKHKIAAFCFFTGYMLDNVDGIMARRYKMYSKLGEALDLVSDQVVNIIFLFVIYIAYQNYDKRSFMLITFAIIIFYIALIYWYIINEAVLNHDKTGNDNFYEEKKKRFKNENNILTKIYLALNYSSYRVYKLTFSTYNKKKLKNIMKYVKLLGPGNIVIIVSIFIYLYKPKSIYD